MNYTIRVKLQSDTSFGKGDGVPGLLDMEIEHDPLTGLPVIPARRLRGLIVEECANMLFAMRLADNENFGQAMLAANELFGQPGSKNNDFGALAIGAATLPAALQHAVAHAIHRGKVLKQEVLDAFTTIRRQTAIHPLDGVPESSSLRAQRAVIRNTVFEATAEVELTALDLPFAEALLASCVMSVKRGGTGRNRGRGKVTAELLRGNVRVSPELLFREAPKC